MNESKIYFVEKCNLSTTKNNRPYGALSLISEEGLKFQVNVWELSENLAFKQIETSAGMVPDSKGYISFQKSAISIIQDADERWAQYLPKVPTKSLFCSLFLTLRSVGGNESEVGSDEMDVVKLIYDKYCLWTAASNNHHSYPGGLAQHTYEVMLVLFHMKKELLLKKGVDFVAVAWGALLHDYGKLFDYDEAMEPTKDLYLIYHTAQSYKNVERVLPESLSSNKSLVKHIEHIVLSHHGKKEWGSPVVPATYEAFMVSMADMISGHGYEFLHTDDMTKSYALDRKVITTI